MQGSCEHSVPRPTRAAVQGCFQTTEKEQNESSGEEVDEEKRQKERKRKGKTEQARKKLQIQQRTAKEEGLPLSCKQAVRYCVKGGNLE